MLNDPLNDQPGYEEGSDGRACGQRWCRDWGRRHSSIEAGEQAQDCVPVLKCEEHHDHDHNANLRPRLRYSQAESYCLLDA